MGVAREAGFKLVVCVGLVFSLPFSVSDKALDLLTQLLSLNPADRPSAAAAMDHDYFWALEPGAKTDISELRARCVVRGAL